MKRFLLFAVAVLAFVGCNEMFKDEGNSSLALSELPTLMAGFEDADTRTYVESNKYLRWHEGDLISAFVGDTKNVKYVFDGMTGDTSGEFKPANDENVGSDNIFDNIYAVYPYYVSTAISNDGVIDYFMPDIQTYDADTFGRGANTAVAITESTDDTSLMFKNVGGYLKIRLYGEGTVKSIELRGNNGEKIAGNANITATYGGVPKIAMADDATESIILDCGDGVELSADAESPTVFWVVVPPTTFESGITITVTDTEGGVFEKSTDKQIAIERNVIQPMSAVEAEFEVYDPTKPAKNEIWYTSTDGNIVTPYMSNVFGATIVSNTYEDGKGIITFDDTVTIIGDGAFFGCSSLTSVTIPDSVTTIGDDVFSYCNSLASVTIGDSVTTIGGHAFSWCSSLTSITIPDSVTTIGNSAFFWCSSLTSVTIGDSVTTIGDWAFSYCSSLTSVTIPDSVTTIGESAFEACSSLTSVTIPDSVITIGDYTFEHCSNLTSITIPDSVTTIGDGAFFGCSSLTSVTIPDSVTTIGGYAFYSCVNLTSVTIGDSVTTIGGSAFSGCAGLKEVYCKPTTPPTMGGSVFANVPLEAIYVPTASVNDYKTAGGWCDYADYIVG